MMKKGLHRGTKASQKRKKGLKEMLLVTQSKRRINQLGYNKKTREYVYLHNGVEIWREKGDESLLKYFGKVRAGMRFIEDEDIAKLTTASIWKKYSDSCQEFAKKEGWL